MSNIETLIIWKRSRELVKECYALTRNFPRDELFGLTSQLRRAAVSVPANIAEGYGRRHRREFLHFLSIACGSLYELETHLHVAVDLGFASRARIQHALDLASECGRMATALRRSKS